MHEVSTARHRFCFPVTVRFADTDCQGHVYFSNYLVYCDEDMSAYLNAGGCGWRELQALGLEFYFVDTGCQFKGRARFEDELHVHVRMARMGKSSFAVEMAIYQGADGPLVASAYITAVMVEYTTGRPTPVPAVMRKAVGLYEEGND